MELRDLQLKELDMVKVIVPILNKHNLRYFMLSGTFLGAIRHNGFIPWDDDIDLGMPRLDYEKFIEIADKELPDYLQLVHFNKVVDYNKYHMRVIDKRIKFFREDTFDPKETNLWIDIFPLDGVPTGKVSYTLYKFCVLYRRMMFNYSVFDTGINIKKKRSIFKKMLIILGAVYTKIIRLNPKTQLNKLDKLLKKYAYDDSKYVGNHMGGYPFKEVYPREYFDNSKLYTFEDIELPAPENYDAVLKQLYGDYMIPPNSDQRFSHSIKITEV